MMKDLKVLVLKFHKSGKRIFELIHRQFRKPTKNKGAFLKGVLEISCQSDKIQILRVENARRKTNRF